jgi:TonB-dependent receptor
MQLATRTPSPQQGLRLTALAFGILCAFDVQARQVAGPNADLGADSVVNISGQRASIRKAVLLQDAANNIVSVVSADDIGALPDINAAEALARMPGISVQRDQGEGRYVTVRGLGPDLNTVTINGALVPAPENGRRGVSLDVIPAGMIRTLQVTKTLTPDMDANSLGGTVDVQTLSAFDLRGRTLTLSATGGYNTLSHDKSPGFGLFWADRFLDGKLGVAIGASGERRRLASDDVETGGAWTASGRLTALELRDYQPVRENQAIGLNLDYHPQTGQALYLRSFHSTFSDDERRDRLTISNITGGSAAAGDTVTARAERRLRERKYTRNIDSLVVGGDLAVQDWTLAARAGSSKAGEDQPNALNDVQFRQNGVTGISFTDTRLPVLSGPSTLYDASKYNLTAITYQGRVSDDKEQHARFDLSRKLSFDGADSTIQFGAKRSRREKTNDTNQWAFTSASAASPNYWGAGPTTLAGFVGGTMVNFPQQIGLAIDPALVRARTDGLNAAKAASLSASTVNDWTIDENINSLYLQASTDLQAWNVLVGVRREQTRFAAVGSQLSPTLAVTPVTSQKSYSNVLPNFQVRYKLDDSTSIRAAMTRAVVRANFSQLAPGVALASPTEATIGNPDLRPLRSNNLDLGIERTLGLDGNLALYAFKKDIKDFTYQTNLAGTGQWAGYTTATGFVNGDAADLSGVELGYQQALRFLPGAWSGLIAGVNATYTRSSTTLTRFDKSRAAMLAREVVLPGQSARIMNLMIGYESGPFSARLAANMKSRYLLQTGADVLDAGQDTWVDAQRQLDLSLRYHLSKGTRLSFEVLNLNKESYYTYLGKQAYNAQNEQYGRTFRVSLSANIF